MYCLSFFKIYTQFETAKTIYLIFNIIYIDFIVLYEYMVILNLMRATRFKQEGTEPTKDREGFFLAQKHLFGTGWIVTGDGVMIGYKRGILERSAAHTQGWGKVDCFVKHMITFRSAVHLQMIEFIFIFASQFFGNLGRQTSKWRKLVCVSCSLAVRSCSRSPGWSHNELLFSVSGKARLYSRNQGWYPPMSSNHTEPLEYMSRVQT